MSPAHSRPFKILWITLQVSLDIDSRLATSFSVNILSYEFLWDSLIISLQIEQIYIEISHYIILFINLDIAASNSNIYSDGTRVNWPSSGKRFPAFTPLRIGVSICSPVSSIEESWLYVASTWVFQWTIRVWKWSTFLVQRITCRSRSSMDRNQSCLDSLFTNAERNVGKFTLKLSELEFKK